MKTIKSFLSILVSLSLALPSVSFANDPYKIVDKTLEVLNDKAMVYGRSLARQDMQIALEEMMGEFLRSSKEGAKASELSVNLARLGEDLNKFINKSFSSEINEVEFSRLLDEYVHLNQQLYYLSWTPVMFRYHRSRFPMLIMQILEGMEDQCQKGRSAAEFVIPNIDLGKLPKMEYNIGAKVSYSYGGSTFNGMDNPYLNDAGINFQQHSIVIDNSDLDQANQIAGITLGLAASLYLSGVSYVGMSQALATFSTAMSTSTAAAAGAGAGAAAASQVLVAAGPYLIALVVILTAISYYSARYKYRKAVRNLIGAKDKLFNEMPRDSDIANHYKSFCEESLPGIQDFKKDIQLLVTGTETQKANLLSLATQKNDDLNKWQNQKNLASEASCRLGLMNAYNSNSCQNSEIGEDGKPDTPIEGVFCFIKDNYAYSDMGECRINVSTYDPHRKSTCSEDYTQEKKDYDKEKAKAEKEGIEWGVNKVFEPKYLCMEVDNEKLPDQYYLKDLETAQSRDTQESINQDWEMSKWLLLQIYLITNQKVADRIDLIDFRQVQAQSQKAFMKIISFLQIAQKINKTNPAKGRIYNIQLLKQFGSLKKQILDLIKRTIQSSLAGLIQPYESQQIEIESKLNALIEKNPRIVQFKQLLSLLNDFKGVYSEK